MKPGLYASRSGKNKLLLFLAPAMVLCRPAGLGHAYDLVLKEHSGTKSTMCARVFAEQE